MDVKKIFVKILCFFTLITTANPLIYSIHAGEPVLYRWEPIGWDNFGDAISQPIVERILARKVKMAPSVYQHKMLAVGSILHSAINGDVVWGSGIMTGWFPDYITSLDVRAV